MYLRKRKLANLRSYFPGFLCILNVPLSSTQDMAGYVQGGKWYIETSWVLQSEFTSDVNIPPVFVMSPKSYSSCILIGPSIHKCYWSIACHVQFLFTQSVEVMFLIIVMNQNYLHCLFAVQFACQMVKFSYKVGYYKHNCFHDQ